MNTATQTIAPELVGTWDIDPNHSTVEAVARYAMLTSVRGRFTSVKGEITVGETLEQSHVNVEIDAASIDTRNETRDGHLRSEDFLHVEQHPVITFHSTRVEEADEGSYRVWGDLTMRGVTKQVELDVDFGGTGADPWGNTRAGVEAKATINRKEWGVNWNAALEAGGVLVGDKLKIELNISAIKRAEAAKVEEDGAAA
jgi:polyisoprenoid-binding protein YceI